jgi:hypothetical protein
MTTWTVYEHARLYRDNHTEIDGDDLRLSGKQFDGERPAIPPMMQLDSTYDAA